MRTIAFTIAAAMLLLGGSAGAQRVHPIGVVSRRAADSATETHARSITAVRNDPQWDQRSFWKWTGIGILSGAAVGVTWAAIAIGHSDDPMLGGLGLAIGAGGGAIVGGLSGAFLYAISRSPGRPSMNSPR
jgi:hypothetical protein